MKPNAEVRIEESKCHDAQLIAFLTVLFRRPDDLVQIMAKISDKEKNFYIFNMYFDIAGIIQKYKVAVDDYLPLTQEGSNLFSQTDNPNNVLLPLLEKAWAKYVYANEIRELLVPGSVYIDKIMLAFLGCPSLILSTTHQDFVQEFDAHFFEGAYAFCFINKTHKIAVDAGKNNAHKELKPFLLKAKVKIDLGLQQREVYFLQALDGLVPPSTDNKDLNLVLERDFPTLMHSGASEEGRRYFYMLDEDFMELVSEVYICTYKLEDISRHFSCSFKSESLEGTKFEVFVVFI